MNKKNGHVHMEDETLADMTRIRRKRLETAAFACHAASVGSRTLRITMTNKVEMPPEPGIAIRPEIRKAFEESAATYSESIMDAVPTQEVSIAMGDVAINIIWEHGTLYVRTADGRTLVAFTHIDAGVSPACTLDALKSTRIYGMGEKYAWINRQGTRTENWNTDVMGLTDLHHGIQKAYHTAIPFHIHDLPEAGLFVGIHWDNTWRTAYDFNSTDDGSHRLTAEGGSLDFWITWGPTVQDVVRGYALQTGTMPMPAISYLGFQQCRWSYMDQEEVLEIARSMRQHKVPCDVIYLDIDYMDAYKVFTIDKTRFPDFKGMTEELRSLGFKTVAIIDPGVKAESGYGVHDRGLEMKAYVTDQSGEPYVGAVWPGPAVFPDFLNKKARDWWGAEHEVLFDAGIDGIWNDMNEPADFTTETKTIPETCVHMDDNGVAHPHAEIHNVYATYEAMSTMDAMTARQDVANAGTRPFILTRSASAGAQRHTAIWTGDNSSLWEHMEAIVPMLINLGLSGFAFAGGDVGGFLEDSSGEMLTRWTQLGAFMPLFRNHSAKDTKYQEPWRFGDQTLENVKKATELRYSLVTYLYQQMKIASETGDPVVRPLFYGLPAEMIGHVDSNIWHINDSFLYGPDLLVCPVVRPGMTKRAVYFPPAGLAETENKAGIGHWIDIDTGERHAGDSWAIVDAQIDRIPVFVREGAILVRDGVREHLDVKDPFEGITLEIYGTDMGPASMGEATFYFDDGKSLSPTEHCLMVVAYTVRGDSEVDVVVTTKGNRPAPKLDVVWKGGGKKHMNLRLG